MPVVFVPQAFTEDDLYVALRSIFGYALYRKFVYDQAARLSELHVVDDSFGELRRYR